MEATFQDFLAWFASRQTGSTLVLREWVVERLACLGSMPEKLVPEFVERLHHRALGWEQLVHPDAEFTLLPFGGQTVYGRNAIARRLDSPSLRLSYRPRVLDLWRLDESTVLVKGTAIYPLPGHGHAGGRAFWLDEIRDGLVWRARGFTTERAARAAYATSNA